MSDLDQERRKAHARNAMEIAQEILAATLHQLDVEELSPEQIAALLGAGPDLNDDANTPSADIRLLLEESMAAREANEIVMLKRRANIKQLQIIGQFVANIATTFGILSR